MMCRWFTLKMYLFISLWQCDSQSPFLVWIRPWLKSRNVIRYKSRKLAKIANAWITLQCVNFQVRAMLSWILNLFWNILGISLLSTVTHVSYITYHNPYFHKAVSLLGSSKFTSKHFLCPVLPGLLLALKHRQQLSSLSSEHSFVSNTLMCPHWLVVRIEWTHQKLKCVTFAAVSVFICASQASSLIYFRHLTILLYYTEQVANLKSTFHTAS